MDLGPTSAVQEGSRRRRKGPFTGVRLRGGRWVSEIRKPKTNKRIWLGSHCSAEKAARAYDAALYCLKGEQGSFNFPNNRRPDLANWPVGSVPGKEIRRIAAEFSCLDESVATSDPPPMLPLKEGNQSIEPPGLPDPHNTVEMGANKVDGALHAPEEEFYVPRFMPEEPYVPVYVPEGEEPRIPACAPETAPGSHGNLQLDEWFGLDGDWMRNFH